MVLKLKFSTGKEIELTSEEYAELVGRGNTIYVPVIIEKQPEVVPYIPIYPQYPMYPWQNPVITCYSTNNNTSNCKKE